MTLQEAHEIQRKELIALRHENAKLKNGTYTDAEKLEHEKIIRHLRLENKNLLKAKERYQQLLRDALNRPQHQIEDLIKIEDLEKELLLQKSLNETLSLELQEARNIITKLKAQMNRDHENSSMPSSLKPFHKKIKNSRQKTNRRPGGQPGHAGHKRPRMEPTLPIIDLLPDQSILSNTDYYPTGKFITKQVADINVQVSVTEYRSQIYRNRLTGHHYHAPFPSDVVNEFNYGPKAKAFAFLLNNYCNVSIDKTAEFISGITNSKISLSKGLINSLASSFSAATSKDRHHIYSMLLKAPFMHSDFTPARVNGKNVQVMLCANQDEMLYLLREHKGHEGIKGTPVEEYQQILVHDHDITFYNYGADHQECLSHVLRYLQDSIENEKTLTWNKQMKEFLSSTIHQVKHNRNLSADEISNIEAAYDNILDLARLEYLNNPPNKYYPDGYNLFKRLEKYKHNHLLFLYHPDLEYTNNLAERALRKVKRKLKQAVTFRSIQSVSDLCDCFSIIETKKLQEQNLFQMAEEAFS